MIFDFICKDCKHIFEEFDDNPKCPKCKSAALEKKVPMVQTIHSQVNFPGSTIDQYSDREFGD